MKDNMYTRTVRKIKATDSFKKKLLEQNDIFLNTVVKKKKFLQMNGLPALAASLILICGLIAFSGILPFSQASSPSVDHNKIDVQRPYFTINNKDYIIAGVEIIYDLPEGYLYYGNIIISDPGNIFNHFSTYKVYTHPERPYSAYLYTDNLTGNDMYGYTLFITSELVMEMIYYNNNLYMHYDTVTAVGEYFEDVDTFHVVGNIQKINLDILPSQEFQSNSARLLGCKIYASDRYPNTIYFEISPDEYGQCPRIESIK